VGSGPEIQRGIMAQARVRGDLQDRYPGRLNAR